MGSRRKAREYALQMLYQVDLRQCSADEIFRTFWLGMSPPDEDVTFATEVVRGVIRDVRRINGLIETHSHHWRLERMAPVDRNILRMGIFELLNLRDIPISVTINEAIELGKRYSTIESGGFINAILDQVARGLPVGSKVEDSLTDSDGEYLDYDDD